MPVWLSLFVAVFGAVGFFATLYAVVIGVIEARRAKAKPRLGIASGSRPGTFTFWATWQPEMFALQVYRLRISLYNPNGEIKENVFTVSYDPVQKAPFAQEVELPPTFLAVLEKQSPKVEGIVTVDFRTVEEFTLPVNYKLSYLRKVVSGHGPKAPKVANTLAPTAADPATVMTLDYSELVVRKKKLRDLEAAAKAKAAKAPPPPAKPQAAASSAAPAAAAGGGSTAAPASATSGASAAAPASATSGASAVAPASAMSGASAVPAKEVAAAKSAPTQPSIAPAATSTPVAAPVKPLPSAKEVSPSQSEQPSGKAEAIPSIRSVIKQANAKEKTPRPGEELSDAKPKTEG